jgi:hypothetical protein
MPSGTTPALVFDPVTHTSMLPDGRNVPHVTAILAAVGVATDFDTIAGFSRRLGEQIDLKRQIGTATHQDCHAFDDDDLVWETVDPRVKPYVDAWVTCRQNTGLQPVARERHLFHPVYVYCGIFDGVFMHPTGGRILADLKIGDPEDAAARFQLAAYAAAYEHDHPDQPIDQRWAIWLCPERAVPYRITNYSAEPDAWQDFHKFQAFLTTYHEQPGRRRRVR